LQNPACFSYSSASGQNKEIINPIKVNKLNPTPDITKMVLKLNLLAI
jgi:hypothetical protein